MLGLHAQLLRHMSEHGLNPGVRLRALVHEGDAPSLLHLVPGVCGAAVVFGGKTSTVGTVPEAGVLQEVVKVPERATEETVAETRSLVSASVTSKDPLVVRVVSVSVSDAASAPLVMTGVSLVPVMVMVTVSLSLSGVLSSSVAVTV